MNLMRGMILTLALSAIGAALGAWGGSQYVLHRMQRPTPLHEMVHERLHLSADQQRRISGLEREHAARRQVLEAEMQAANAQLARALQARHAYTPQVQAAVDRLHRAMGGLQKETIVHVLAMRAVLTPHQAVKFDEMVVKSLTQDPR